MSTFKIITHIEKVIFEKKYDKNIDQKINRKIIYFSRNGSNYYDDISLYNDTIYISGNRTKPIVELNILKTVNSTFYYSLVKALLFVYFEKHSFLVKTIEVIVDDKSIIKYNEEDIHQVFKNPKNSNISEIKCDKLFVDKKVSDIAMNALMNLTMSFKYSDLKFDYTWKCFNGLIRHIFNKDKDFEMLRELRNDIEKDKKSETNLYSKTMDFSSELTYDYIKSLSIKAMICNNYPKDKTKGLYEFLKSFTDYRIVKVLSENLSCKKNELNSINKFEEICEYYSKLLKYGCTKTNDIDVIRFVILKYAYYLRCKYFHAEKIPANFLIENMSQNELNKITEPLSIICYDLFINRL